MLFFMLATAWLIAWRAPETAIGRALHRATVVWPARRLGEITRGRVLVWAALLAVVGAVAWLGGREAVTLLAMAGPDATALMATVDVAMLAEAALAAMLAATALRVRGAMIARRGPRRSGRARATRRPIRAAANDDDDRPARRVG